MIQTLLHLPPAILYALGGGTLALVLTLPLVLSGGRVEIMDRYNPYKAQRELALARVFWWGLLCVIITMLLVMLTQPPIQT